MAKVKRYETFWATKWLTEGAQSLQEMAEQLEMAAKELLAMAETGKVQMAEPVDGGHALFTTEDPEVAARFGMTVPEWDEEDEDEDLDGEDEDGPEFKEVEAR